MAYRLGTYAGHHTLYDELDPSVAAARRAMHCPVGDFERDSQWALLDHHKDKRRLQAIELEMMKNEQRSMSKCGMRNCWCNENPGRGPEPGMSLDQHSKEYILTCFANFDPGMTLTQSPSEVSLTLPSSAISHYICFEFIFIRCFASFFSDLLPSSLHAGVENMLLYL